MMFPAQPRDEIQRARGICSVAECDEPIIGWCATCNDRGPFQAPKLCAAHLLHHLAASLPATHWPYLPYDRNPDDGQGGAA